MSEKYFVGIDLGGTNLKVGLLDERYRIVDKLVLSTRDLGCRDELIKAICSAVKDVVSDNKLKNHIKNCREIFNCHNNCGLRNSSDFGFRIVDFGLF